MRLRSSVMKYIEMDRVTLARDVTNAETFNAVVPDSVVRAFVACQCLGRSRPGVGTGSD